MWCRTNKLASDLGGEGRAFKPVPQAFYFVDYDLTLVEHALNVYVFHTVPLGLSYLN